MKLYGNAAVSEFLDDNVIYRNLKPIDERLPSLDDLREMVGLPSGLIPRKSTPKYAQVVAEILTAARRLDAPGTSIERVVFIGDTRLNDSTAFANICRAGNWPGRAFIGSENDDRKTIEFDMLDIGMVMAANKWNALVDFEDYLAEQEFPIDENTAVLLDLDKTTLGARGRNDQVINQARVDAAVQVVKDVLGVKFDAQEFQNIYDHFNQVEFHPFTTDNQDYLVYVSLIVGSGLYTSEGLEEAINGAEIETFGSFLQQVDRRLAELPPELHDIHDDVYHRYQAGDPTPFKAFRRAEFIATAARMGQTESAVTVEDLLSRKIVLTHEVRQLMLAWRNQGALLFGLSDKPDEASIPTEEMAYQGHQPIHRIVTSVVGV
ncbi:MAG TPA: hypothetical protein VLE70_02080 [Anaerolineae bacterium]|jgi:hypothetical protein|nr:hypothetical protein [Anaerolineae bacterium]